MNEIETRFYNTFLEYLNNNEIYVNDKVYKLGKYEFGYQLDSKQDETCIFFDIKVQPKNDCFSGYVPDFCIYMNGAEQGYVIEIDGHEWHEKTKEQAKADKEKDRAYLKHGFIPIRFTGSEVFHHAKDCIRELFEIIEFNAQYFEYDSIKALYENEKLTSEYNCQEKDKIQEKLYQICYGNIAKKAIFISNGKVELTPNITETA